MQQRTVLSDEDIAAVNNIRNSYVQAVHAGNVDVILALHAEDAFLMPPDMPAIEGREAMRVLFPEANESFVMTSAKIDGRDGLAFDRGTWSLTEMVADTAVEFTGKYLCIAGDQAYGSWFWTDTIWNNDAPMPQPE